MSQAPFSWLAKLNEIRAGLAADPATGLATLQQALQANPLQGYEVELIGRVLRAISDGGSDFPRFRVALLSNVTTEPIANALRVALLREGFLPDIYEAPYGSYRQEILAPNSGLYEKKPDAILIASSFVEPSDFGQPMSDAAVEAALTKEVQEWTRLWDLLGERISCPVLQHVFEVPEEDFLGVAERRSKWTCTNRVEGLNDRLIQVAPGFVYWVDVDRLAARIGRQNWRDVRLYHHGKYAFSPKFLAEYTDLIGATIRVATGRTKKALIVDLDNTLWGGVIGDDRIEGVRLGPDSAEGSAHYAFCTYVKQLGMRGVILGICSKNDLSIASEVFAKHPHMPLQLSDFAVVACNWNDKASNLAAIARELNIDTSAMVFVDDNPAECELIRQAMPSVCTVLMDGDPALFVRKLDRLRLFEMQALSQEDLKRAASYQALAKSKALEADFLDMKGYLSSLEMRATVQEARSGDLRRLAQMEIKTNQFNLSTRRLTLHEIEEMASSPAWIVLTAQLVDKFADHGLVAYLTARIEDDRVTIVDWVMSCRVFSRTLEHFVFSQLCDRVLTLGVRYIDATFVPTPKNKVMETLFDILGFSCVGTAPAGPWRYDLHTAPRPTSTILAEDAMLKTSPHHEMHGNR